MRSGLLCERKRYDDDSQGERFSGTVPAHHAGKAGRGLSSALHEKGTAEAPEAGLSCEKWPSHPGIKGIS